MPMNQTDLYEIALRLKPGEAVMIEHADIVECTLRQQSSLLFASTPTREDIEHFVTMIMNNWDIDLIQNPMNLMWTMRKVR